MSPLGSVSIACADERCGRQLGWVGVSALSGHPRPVWKIQPGWMFRAGILEHIDETFRSERRLFHEMTGGPRPEGLSTLRECDLPLCVRCPWCHRMRWVAPDVVFAGNPG